MPSPLLKAKDIEVAYPIHKGLLRRVHAHVPAVRNVSLSIEAGEIVALVGESGCGKSSLGTALLGLNPAANGKLIFNKQTLDLKNPSDFQSVRKELQIIFQDPYSTLNPRQTVYEILSEPLLLHNKSHYKNNKKKLAQKAIQLLEQVGLNKSHLHLYPHAFSGGQRQRLCIARVISLEPKVIICDEIVSALDISVQAQIVQLLLQLKRDLGMALFWISHDLALVRNISDYVHVMYLGQIVESAHCEQIFTHPQHPYTQALLAAIPSLDTKHKPVALHGEIPSLRNLPTGCSFQTRCSYVQKRCREEDPTQGKELLQKENYCACFFPL